MATQTLVLDRSGQPNRWAKWQDVVTYQAKGLITWSLGEVILTAHGGKNRFSGEQSIATVPSIISVNSNVVLKYKTPALTNRNLFRRDLNICAYCNRMHPDERLTRDHIHPESKDGPNTWMNCVTACKACNNYKADFLLEDIDMELIYLPYVPDRNEALILSNRSIKADQMEFLLPFIPSHSRVHKMNDPFGLRQPDYE